MMASHAYQPNGLGGHDDNGNVQCARCGRQPGVHADQQGTRQGWECPRCRTVYAPSVRSCSCQAFRVEPVDPVAAIGAAVKSAGLRPRASRA